MREHLYRGKRVDNGEWIESKCILQFTDSVYFSMAYGNIEVIPETVGEWTGLTDKNGKKIFEGDIHENNGNKYVVKYGSCYDADRECNCFGWYFEATKNKGYCECFDGTEGEYANIIGNIHDNPELLEGK